MPNKLLESTVEKIKEKKAERRLKKKAKRAQKNRDEQKRRRRIERNEPEGASEKAQATVRQGRRLAGELGVTTDKAKSAASTAGSAAEGLGSAFAPSDGGNRGARLPNPRPPAEDPGIIDPSRGSQAEPRVPMGEFPAPGGSGSDREPRVPMGELPDPGSSDAPGPFKIRSSMGDDDREPPFF